MATRAYWMEVAGQVAAVAAQHAARHDTDDSFVEEGFAALDEADFFSALVPTDLGGGGARVGEICDALRRVARDCSSTALAAAMHSHIVAVAAWRWKHQGAPTDGLLKRVAGYTVYRDGEAIGQVAVSAYEDSSVAAGKHYRYAVDAFDPSGNPSPRTEAIHVSAAGPPACRLTVGRQCGADTVL